MKKIYTKTALSGTLVTALIIFTFGLQSTAFASPEIECAELTLKSFEVKPMTWIKIEGLPEDYDEELIANAYLDGERTGAARTVRSLDDEYYLIIPPNPMMEFDGVDIEFEFEDENVSCPRFVFRIKELEPDPIDLQGMLSDIEEYLEIQAELFDTTIDELAQKDEETAPFHLLPAITLSKHMRGNEGYFNFYEHFDNDNLRDELSEQEFELILTLYNRAGQQRLMVNEPKDAVRFDNGRLEGIQNRQSGSIPDLNTKPELWASAAGIPNPEFGRSRPLNVQSMAYDVCNDVTFGVNTAEDLQARLWAHQRRSAVLDRLQFLGDTTEVVLTGLTIVAIMNPGTAKAASISRSVGITGTSFAVLSYFANLNDALYPSRIWGFNVQDIGPLNFGEDAEDMTGSWKKAYLSASNQEMEIVREYMGLFWGRMGGKFMKKIDNNSARELKILIDGNKFVISRTVADMIKYFPEDLGTIPECHFGPYDILDEKWTQLRLFDNAEMIELTSSHDYRVTSIGEEQVHACLLDSILQSPDIFRGPGSPHHDEGDGDGEGEWEDWDDVNDRNGNRDQNGDSDFDPDSATCIESESFLISVVRIDVRIVPENIPNVRGTVYVEPGKVIELTGLARNAEDPTIGWSLDPTGPHAITAYGIGEEATVVTSGDPDDFPFWIVAESLSFTGLRAKPDARPRWDRMKVDAAEPEVEEVIEEFIDCRDDQPIRLQELTPCTFVAYMEGPEIRRRGYPDFPAEHCYAGNIESMGTNQHGVFNMNWSGEFDGRRLSRVMFRIHPPENDRYTYETEGVYFGGGLAIYYEQERRVSPMSRETRMATTVAEHSFETVNRYITIYPLAGTNLWAGFFEADVITNPQSRARRDEGKQKFHGVFLLGEECRWE